MTRVFIALDLSDDVRAALRRELRRLGSALPGVRGEDPANLHLTLAFLGELDDDALVATITLADEVASQTATFHLALGGLGFFGPPTAPRVIWAGVAGETRSLFALQRRLADTLAERGFPREQRPYSPHLTLARLKRPLDEGAYQRLRAVLDAPTRQRARWQVDDLRVMRSERTPEGSRYTALSIARLVGAAPRGKPRPDR